LHEANGIVGNMRALGISLIIAGLALVCGSGLILWPRASQTEEEEETESWKEEKTETGGMADLLQRLNEPPTMILSNKQLRKKVEERAAKRARRARQLGHIHRLHRLAPNSTASPTRVIIAKKYSTGPSFGRPSPREKRPQLGLRR
jgi:hypothetical protein